MKTNKKNYVIEYLFNNISTDSETLSKSFYKDHPDEIVRKSNNNTIATKEVEQQIKAELIAIFSNKRIKNLFIGDETGKYKKWSLSKEGIDYYNKIKLKKSNEIDFFKKEIENLKLENELLKEKMKEYEIKMLKLENSYLRKLHMELK